MFGSQGGKADVKAGLMPNYPSDFSACGCMVRNAFGIAAGAVIDAGGSERVCTKCGSTWQGDIKRLAPVQFPDQRKRFRGRSN